MNSVVNFVPQHVHYYLGYQSYQNTVIGNWEEGVYYINDGESNNLIDGIYPQPTTTNGFNVKKSNVKNIDKIKIEM